MTVPTVNAVINFSTGPAFAQAMILDQGILGTNVLADSAAVIVDVSNVVDSIQTIRGRSNVAELLDWLPRSWQATSHQSFAQY